MYCVHIYFCNFTDYNETRTVYGIDHSNQIAPRLILGHDYHNITLRVHPEVYEYVDVSASGKIEKKKLELM